MIVGIACCLSGPVGAQSYTAGQNYYGQTQDSYSSSEPMAYSSPPPRVYVSPSPQDFVVVPDQHNFYDSRLPAVGDTRPRVLIRTYNPDIGVYTDTEIRDPRVREVVSDY
jgi:hypothetical protein